MNEIINRDYRKKDNLAWLNDNFFIAVYDQNDNYITSFDNIESIATAFNIKLSKLLKHIRYNISIQYDNCKLKLFVYKKEKIKEEVRRR